MALAGEPPVTHGPERVMSTRTVSFGFTNTLLDTGVTSNTSTEKGYSTVVPTCWFRTRVFAVGVSNASLSASPLIASARAAEAVSRTAAATASVTNGALRRAPMARLLHRSRPRPGTRCIRQEVSAEQGITLDN